MKKEETKAPVKNEEVDEIKENLTPETMTEDQNENVQNPPAETEQPKTGFFQNIGNGLKQAGTNVSEFCVKHHVADKAKGFLAGVAASAVAVGTVIWAVSKDMPDADAVDDDYGTVDTTAEVTDAE